jgi:hypothetical protein
VAQRVFAVRYEWTKVLVLVGLSSAANYGGSLLELGAGPFVLKCLLMFAWLAAICLTGVVSCEDRWMVQRIASSALGRVADFAGVRRRIAPAADVSDSPACPDCMP